MAPFKNLSTTIKNIEMYPWFRLPRRHVLAFSFLLISVLCLFNSVTNQFPSFTPSIVASRLLFAASCISPFSSDTCLVSALQDNCTLSLVTAMEGSKRSPSTREGDDCGDGVVGAHNGLSSCDIFDGSWVVDDSGPMYRPGSCPFVDDSFNCFKNGRKDTGYLNYRWKPHGCQLPRFNGTKMLGILRGKRMVFVGDSLNRNMWESLVCALRESFENKYRIVEVSGRRGLRDQGIYSYKFVDYECSLDFIKSPFLVQEWKDLDRREGRRETLRLDMIHSASAMYRDADIIVFNTGHWWTHQKTGNGSGYFQEGRRVYRELDVTEAYRKALQTWANWVDSNINSSRTRVFFRGYSPSHFRKGQWNSGGHCSEEMEPITNDTQLAPFPWMMTTLQEVISEMRTPVLYLNITRMTDYRKEGHPSVYRPAYKIINASRVIQDCSHWCLPGVPDSWNELLFATLLATTSSTATTTSPPLV